MKDLRTFRPEILDRLCFHRLLKTIPVGDNFAELLRSIRLKHTANDGRLLVGYCRLVV